VILRALGIIEALFIIRVRCKEARGSFINEWIW
jgi:hypothetical protein